MHLLINLAIIRLSLQIVIPGIMIVFKRQKEKHQHHSLLSQIPATTLVACDGWLRKRGRGQVLCAFSQASELWAYSKVAMGTNLGLRIASDGVFASLAWLLFEAKE